MSEQPSYATGQLAKALARLLTTNDPGALKKVRQWQSVLAGIHSGQITVGSRTPVEDTPAWVTLEVAHGGFATGAYLAEAPLTDDETLKLSELPDNVPGETDRERLNNWYLGDVGMAELLAALRSGHYRVELPEDAALAVLVLLLDKDFISEAMDVLVELRPLMSRLRFTPRFEPVARPSGSAVRVGTVRDAIQSMRAVRMPRQIAAMRTTLGVWTPLYDRLVALWCQTVDGELPYVDGSGVVRGGWPGRRWPEGWADGRARWLADYEATALHHKPSGRHAHRRSNFVRLRNALLTSDALQARDVGWVRRAIANTVTRNGAPDSERRAAIRATQAVAATAPTNAGLAQVVIERMAGYPGDGGLPSLEPIIDDVAGTPVPRSFQDKVARALEAPVDELVRRGVITSGEVLAIVLPQLTSRLMASGIEDPVLSGLFEQTYAAFRRRRGLLLLNLEHQVRFDELPWIKAIEPLRSSTQDKRAAAHQSLRQVTMLAITEFPHAILPNPLVREIGALAERAGLNLPLVEEVAADIFMGTFTVKWREAVIVAGRTMAGTLYADYYDLPSEKHWQSGRRAPVAWGKKTAGDFADLCTQRAREAGTSARGGVASRGAVLEQSQILTIHNLASLVTELGLTGQIRERADELAWKAFDWTARRLTQPTDNHHAALIQVKNAAYAWRQAIFLLSFAEREQQAAVLRKLDDHIRDLGISRFAPAVRGLAGVFEGKRFNAVGTFKGGRRFLGWAVGRHWLLDR